MIIRNDEVGASSPTSRPFAKRVLRIGENIGNMDDAALKQSTPDHASPRWSQQHLLRNFRLLLGRVTVSCHLLVTCASVAVNRRDLRFEKLSRGLDQGIKYDL